MPTLQLKRGNAAQVAAITPAAGEPVVNTTTNRLVIGDGTTAGGIPLTVVSSDKLSTPRTIQVNLASTSAVSFDGTANISPGVTGTLPLVRGGTGATTGPAARAAIGAVGNLINVQTFTANGTYTPTANTSAIIVELVGGGGQGGGCAATTSGTSAAAAPGGGGGAYIRHYMTSGFSGAAVVIGAGGSAGAAGAAGANGSASTFAGTLTAGGGVGGALGGAGASGFTVGAAGGTVTGGNIVSSTGSFGGMGQVFSTTLVSSGMGGFNNLYTAGGAPSKASSGAGTAATQYGCGGGGASNIGTQAAAAGGAGLAGICIIYEYA